MAAKKVYITGLGFITSIGNDIKEVSSSLISQKHGIVVNPVFEDEGVPVSVMGKIKGFDVDSSDFEDWSYPDDYKIRREIMRGLAPHGVYAYCAMLQSIADARLSDEEVSNRQTGLYAASGGSPFLHHYNINRMNTLGVMRCSPTGIVSSISGTLNFNMVAAFKVLGVSCGFSSACASSGHAMGFAYDEIHSGRQKRMFVVGAEDCNRESVLPFAGMRALSLEKDPAKASRPFDRDRSGFVGTGGGCVMVLESEEEVGRRGVVPYAEFVGWGQASDGHNVAISHPDGEGLKTSMEYALESCGMKSSEIDYVNAHATSTSIGDRSELRALKKVFGTSGERPKVSSTKGLTGHGLSLSSVMEAGFTALGIRDGFTPGSAHIETLDPECDGVNILRETLSEGPEIALSNSSGFGGANVSVVLRRV